MAAGMSGAHSCPKFLQTRRADCLASRQVGMSFSLGSGVEGPEPRREWALVPPMDYKSARHLPHRFSQMVQDKPLRTSWQRKMKDRQERKLAKDFARHLEEEKERRRQVRGQPAGLRLELRGLIW